VTTCISQDRQEKVRRVWRDSLGMPNGARDAGVQNRCYAPDGLSPRAIAVQARTLSCRDSSTSSASSGQTRTSWAGSLRVSVRLRQGICRAGLVFLGHLGIDGGRLDIGAPKLFLRNFEIGSTRAVEMRGEGVAAGVGRVSRTVSGWAASGQHLSRDTGECGDGSRRRLSSRRGAVDMQAHPCLVDRRRIRVAGRNRYPSGSPCLTHRARMMAPGATVYHARVGLATAAGFC
jgi:hypothetical protein